MNPLYVPVIESCLHDLALLVLAQQPKHNTTTRAGKLNILAGRDNSGSADDNNVVDYNPIGRSSSVPILLNRLRCLADSSAAATAIATDLRVNENQCASYGKEQTLLKGNNKNHQNHHNHNNNNETLRRLENTLNLMTKIDNQNTLVSSATVTGMGAQLKQNMFKNAETPSPGYKGGFAMRNRVSHSLPPSTQSPDDKPESRLLEEMCSPKVKELAVSGEVALPSRMPGASVIATATSAVPPAGDGKEDAATMAMALDYLKTMTMNLRDTQIDNDKVNNRSLLSSESSDPPTPKHPGPLQQQRSSLPFTGLSLELPQPPTTTTTFKQPISSCVNTRTAEPRESITSTATGSSVVKTSCHAGGNCFDRESNKPIRDPRICKEIIESGNSGNVIPMSSLRFPFPAMPAPNPLVSLRSTTNSPVVMRTANSFIPIPPPIPPPLPSHLFYNPRCGVAHSNENEDVEADSEPKDASTALDHNRGVISSIHSPDRGSHQCGGSIIQAPDPPIRRHFTHSTYPQQIMLRQQFRQQQKQRQEDLSTVSGSHYRIDSGATQNELNIRQHPAESPTRASYSSMVTTMTRTFDLNAAEGSDNAIVAAAAGPSLAAGNSSEDQTRSDAIVAPECDENAEGASSWRRNTGKCVMPLNIVTRTDDDGQCDAGGGSLKRSFSADCKRPDVDELEAGHEQHWNSHAITESRRAPLVALDIGGDWDVDDDHVDRDVAGAAIDVEACRENDIDSLLSGGNGHKTCAVEYYGDNADDDYQSMDDGDAGT